MLKAILTVDVEEWFNLPTLKAAAPPHWKRFESRVVADCDRLLSYLQDWRAHSTWFVVGALAEKLGSQLRAAANAGHKVGCHSYSHRLCSELTAAEFAADLGRATAALQAATGVAPELYRAPMWSLRPHMAGHYEALRDAGYKVSSSWLPGRGSPDDVARFGIREVPVTGNSLGRFLPLPWSGTWRMRRLGARRLLERTARANAAGITPVFWLHSWELDPDPPAIPGGPLLRFVHAHKLAELPAIFAALSREIEWQPLH